MTSSVITSPANKDIKLLRSLHERKYRKQTGWFLAEGMRICREAISLGHAPVRLVYAQGRQDDDKMKALIEACLSSGGRAMAVDPDLLGRISRKDNPQMVIGAFHQKWEDTKIITPQKDRLWIALDRVRDPGNLGTIMRTADAVGATGLLLIEDCTDPYSLEAVRASMGAVFNVKLIRVSEAAFHQFAASWQGEIIGTALQASVDYRDADYSKPTIMLMGNEQAGLTEALRADATQLIRMPMCGRSDSLNLAVATGISLYEWLRVRG
ncbi:MAG: TrmH family RNA methyltransferase [Candidatus Puniceispirillaceae bacterium]